MSPMKSYGPNESANHCLYSFALNKFFSTTEAEISKRRICVMAGDDVSAMVCVISPNGQRMVLAKKLTKKINVSHASSAR
jgi:hypothetical protein